MGKSISSMCLSLTDLDAYLARLACANLAPEAPTLSPMPMTMPMLPAVSLVILRESSGGLADAPASPWNEAGSVPDAARSTSESLSMTETQPKAWKYTFHSTP